MQDETKETALAELNAGSEIAQQNSALNELLFDDNRFNRLHQLAQIMSTGRTTVPKHLHGNVGDCMAVCLQSAQWGLNPIVVSQKTHLVNGTLGYEAQLVHAVLLSSGLFQGRPDFEYVGDWHRIRGKRSWKPEDEEGLGVKVIGIIKSSGQRKEWTTYMTECVIRNSPNWKSKPMLQTSYQAIKEFAREHAPDVLLGVYTIDELPDDPRPTITVEEVGAEGGTRTDRLSSVLGVESDDDIDVKAKEVKEDQDGERKQEIKRVSKQMLDDAVKESGVPEDILIDYCQAKGKLKDGQDLSDLPAGWKRRFCEDPQALKSVVNDWFSEQETSNNIENTDKLRRNFHGVGVEVYGDEWDEMRQSISEHYGVNSSSDLDAEQLTEAIQQMQQQNN